MPAHSRAVMCPIASSPAAPSPSSGGVTYPANAVTIMPGPYGLPLETVTPEVSECSRMLCSWRPVASAASACPPSCAIVTTLRSTCHTEWTETAASAATPVTVTSHHGGCGWVPTTSCLTSPSVDRAMHHL